MMMLRQTIFSIALASCPIVLVAGCSDGPAVPPRTTTTSASSSGASSSGMGGEAGTGSPTGSSSGMAGMGGMGGMGGSGGSGATGGLGTIPVMDVMDSDCATLSGTIVELYPDNSNAPPLGYLTQVNGKRVAGGRWARGFVTFGLNGGSPSPKVVGLDPEFDLVTSEGSTIGLVTSDVVTTRFQRYASTDAPMGNVVDLGNGTGAGLAIAGDGNGGSLMVWADSTSMKGQFVDSNGVAATPFIFANGLSGQSAQSSLIRSGNEFALAWSVVENGIARARFVRLSTTGIIGSIVELTGDAYKHYVVKLVKTANGYALLLHSGGFSFDTILVNLDDQGQSQGSARRFLGTKFAMDLTFANGNLGLMAKRLDGITEFRLLDSNGDPSGDWRCIDGASDDPYDQAAIDVDGAGWAIVYRTPLAGEKFIRTNLTGTGP